MHEFNGFSVTWPAPLDIPPPLPPRPLQWRRAAALLRRILEDPRRIETVFELLEAMGGRSDEATFQLFASDRRGRRLLRERPSLRQALADRAALATLPPASFGRAYLEFTARNDIDPEMLVAANQAAFGRVNAGLDSHRLWFYERTNRMHDLWHVLAGYGTDEAGELGLLAFSIGQGLANRALEALLVAGAVLAPWRECFGFQRYLLTAWRRGRRAAPLFVARYEELLPLPLAEVRRRLGIAHPADAHPRGTYRGSRGGDGLRLVPASEVI